MLRTKKDTKVSKLAGAITHEVIRGDKTEIQAIGAKAVNQTVKAIIVAKMMLKDSDIAISTEADFIETKIGKSPTTLINFKVQKSQFAEDK